MIVETFFIGKGSLQKGEAENIMSVGIHCQPSVAPKNQRGAVC